MPQSYGCIYLHIVFSTKARQSLLSHELHDEFRRYITPILTDCRSELLREGGTSDHVHLLVELGRQTSVADLLREVKSKSSSWLYGRTKRAFSWQSGYGVFSVSPSHLANVMNYIDNQEEHHRHKSFKEEFQEILIAAGVPYDPEYLWVENA